LSLVDPQLFCGRARFALVAVVAALTIAAAPALAQDSPVRAIAKATGYATDVDPPPDFVLKSRPATPPAPMPVFGTPEEPPSKIMSKKEIKAMDADLESAGKKHDVLRSGFAPAARAVAEREAAKQAKSKKKPADAPAKPLQ
jgi:hypothetical protein